MPWDKKGFIFKGGKIWITYMGKKWVIYSLQKGGIFLRKKPHSFTWGKVNQNQYIPWVKKGVYFLGKKKESLKKPHSFTWGKVSQNLYISHTDHLWKNCFPKKIFTDVFIEVSTNTYKLVQTQILVENSGEPIKVRGKIVKNWVK